MDIPFGTVDWIDNLRFDEGRKLALITIVLLSVDLDRTDVLCLSCLSTYD